MRQILIVFSLCIFSTAALSADVGRTQAGAAPPSVGGAMAPTPEPFSVLVPASNTVEHLAGGFEFTEGPVWWRGKLYFSDIPADKVFSWSPAEGVRTYLDPVFLPELKTGGQGGSNGLSVNPRGQLVLAEHGNRRLAVMIDGQRQTLADRYDGRRLNSPNDLIWHSSGAVFFTDPSYGLLNLEQSKAREQPHNGIYRLDPDGTVTLLATQTRPNGIGLSPDETTLYVSNSDPASRVWYAYDVAPDLKLLNKRVFHDASSSTQRGVPDGLAVDVHGHVFATGPGGVWVIDPDGVLLGTISPPEQPANVGFGEDGQSLFITARSGLYRIRLGTTGLVH